MKKSANVMSIAPKTKTRCTTVDFATSAELYSAAKARGNRQATLQPVGTEKQHIRSRRILAFRSATVSTCRSRIFLFQLFSSTSMRISRGCSERETAILTNNEAAKMSKYNTLWKYVKNSGKQSLKLTFDEIQNIAGVPIDHLFLNFKRSLQTTATRSEKSR